MDCITIKLIILYSKPSEEIVVFTIKNIKFRLKISNENIESRLKYYYLNKEF